MCRSDRAISDCTGAGGIVFGRWRRARMMLAADDYPAPSQPEGRGTFWMAKCNIVYRRGGTIDTSSRRLGTNEGRIGGADGDKTRRRQTSQNRLQVFYHVLIGSERTPRGGRAHV